MKNLPSMPELEMPQLAPLIAALSEAPSEGCAYPVGGGVAGIAAALAASLAAAAADCSRTEWDEAAGARAQALALRKRALELAVRGAEAHRLAREVLAARELNVTSGPGAACRETRDWRLGAAVSDAADPPLELTACAADIAQLAGVIASHGAGEVNADASIAATLAAAAARAAARLVEINLIVRGDRETVERARRHVEHADAAASSASDIEI